jgi:hypothetical protein
MSTTQSIGTTAPRLRIGLGTRLIALGVLVAVALTVVILALTGGSRTSSAIPTSHASALRQYPGTGQPYGTGSHGAAQAPPSKCVYLQADHRCFPEQ